MPLIGVCRGMQMMNVASGGTLYGDIPAEIGTDSYPPQQWRSRS